MFLNLIFQKYGTFPSTYEIVGFDNSPIANEAILPITTVGQQIDVIAKTAMDLLNRFRHFGWEVVSFGHRLSTNTVPKCWALPV